MARYEERRVERQKEKEEDAPHYPLKSPPPLSKTPETMPRTTAASVYVYGTAAVTAALKAQRRKLYRLYLLTERDNATDLKPIRKLALSVGVDVKEVNRCWLELMNDVSDGRPHNVSSRRL